MSHKQLVKSKTQIPGFNESSNASQLVSRKFTGIRAKESSILMCDDSTDARNPKGVILTHKLIIQLQPKFFAVMCTHQY